MSAYIYKIENDINGKIYVGKTLENIETRFKNHIQDSKRERCSHRPLYRAFNKYGIEHFHISILEECDPNELNNREIYWIEHLGTYHNGYNATLGGDGTILYDYDTIAELLKGGKTQKEVANIIGCCTDTVSKIAKLYNIAPQISSSQQKIIDLKKTIEQYDLNGNYIQTFNSGADAARWIYENGMCKTLNSGVRSHINDAANGKRKTAYKFIWKRPN